MKKHRNILLVLLFAFVLRISVTHQSFWLDEAINVSAARDRAWTDLLTNYSLGDFHPPLYHIIMKPWIAVFGASEISARMPSILFGLITLYFTYLIAKELLPKKKIQIFSLDLEPTLLPTLWLATSGLHIYYSGEARMYSLAAMGTSGSIYFLTRLIQERGVLFSPLSNLSRLKFSSVAYIFWTVVMLYSDYVPWLLLPLFFLLAPILTSIALALTLPWWPYFYQQLTIGLGTAAEYPGWNEVVGGFSLKNIALIPIKFLIGRVSIENNTLYALAIIPILFLSSYLFFLFLASLTKGKKKAPKKNLSILMLLWLIVPLIIGIGLSLRISLLSYFRFLFILPAMYLIFSIGLLKAPKQLISLAFICLFAINLISSGTYLFNSDFHREDWRGFSEWIDESGAESAVTVIPSLGQAAPYEFYQQSVPIVDELDFTNPPEHIFLLRYVQTIFDPEDLQRQQIEALGYELLAVKYFRGVEVWVYQSDKRVFALNDLFVKI